MKTIFFVACRVTVVTLILTGVAYPLVVTALAQTVFADAARGSWVHNESGRVVGSRLIGQAFTKPAYFHPRPSATSPTAYDAAASGGSNLGPTSKALKERVAAEAARLAQENDEAIPAELVTASASGLDPHLSPAAAAWQVARVAKARDVAVERVAAVVEEFTEGRDLGFLGEPRVNVLQLNVALDRRFGQPR